MFCLNRENLMTLTLLIVIILDIILLSTDSYFSLKPLNSVEFGISGAVIQSKHFSYIDILEDCSLPKYCNFIKDFQKSGMILQALLVLDIITLTGIIIMNSILLVLLRKIINTKENISRCKKIVLRTLAYGKNLLFFHPILLNLGIIAWLVISKLNKHSQNIILHEGLIILIIQSFLSFLSIAYNVWVISSTKRRNLRLLRSKTYKKDDLSISI